ncbi:MAG TPA: hypothetical protein VHS59_14525, partial [Bacillota bacterium]|nr:hypothetical protein [Bacillota bacterium]
VEQTQTRDGGKQVTLNKIEFADTETRVFLTVKNTSNKNVFISLNNPEAVQKDSIVAQLYNLDNNYQMELKPGQQVNGLIILGPVNPLLHSADFRFGNQVLGEQPWVFRVEW